jgi:hypothetical protein
LLHRKSDFSGKNDGWGYQSAGGAHRDAAGHFSGGPGGRVAKFRNFIRKESYICVPERFAAPAGMFVKLILKHHDHAQIL